MPYAGRGGAGNIQAVLESTQRISADLEANRAETEAGSTDQTATRPQQQYAHTGRGGAGNYYSPKNLAETGTYRDSDVSRLIGDGVNTLGSGHTLASPQTAPERTKIYGRGGAGNYAFDAGEMQEEVMKRTAEEERATAEKVKEEVERGVRDTLAVPEKAKVAGGDIEPV